MSALYEPARAMARLTPNANPSWRPTNHWPMITRDGDDHRLGAEAEDEPPAAITGKSGDIAVMAAPIVQMTANTSVEAAGAEPIDDDAADEDHDDVGKAVDRVERADLRVAEAEHPLQQVGNRRRSSRRRSSCRTSPR